MTGSENFDLPYYLGSLDGGVDNRAMVSLGPVSQNRYCHFECKFCYVHGPFPKYQKAEPEEILGWLLENATKYSIIYISGDTDSFVGKRAKKALQLLALIAENLDDLNCDVLFTTRHVFSDSENNTLHEISDNIRRKGRLLIGCVSVCQLNHPELEPHPIKSPYDRIDQLGLWKQIGLSTVLAIRPFIPGVSPDEYVQLASHGARYADVIIGGNLYIDKGGAIQGQLATVLERWDHRAYQSSEHPLDFAHTNDVWLEVEDSEIALKVRDICQKLGKPFFLRSTPAVEHLISNRDYYVGNNNQRMFAANVLASVAIQTSIAARSSEQDQDILGKTEMGFSEFVGTLIRRYDVHPKLRRPDEIGENRGLATIDADNVRFQGAFKMLQEELQTLFLNTFGEARIDSDLGTKTVLYGSVRDVGDLFGSVPAGWDALVRIKRELLTRDRMRSARKRWFLSLMSETEKVLRDLVCTSIVNMGAHPVFQQAIMETSKAHRITEHDVHDASNLEQIASEFSRFMASDAQLTFQVSRSFFATMTPSKSTRSLASMTNMRDALRELGSDRVQIVDRLLDYRNAALHDSDVTDFFPHKNFVKDTKFGDVAHWTVERCALVAEFLCSVCAEAALSCLAAILTGPKSTSVDLSPLIKAKATSEYRVHTLTLLERRSFWLAYFLAEAVDYFLEDGESVMLKLNAAFAFKKIADRSEGKFSFTDRDVPGPSTGVSWHPKHTLIRKSLLEDTSDLRQSMLDASSDMSVDEFQTWPALEFLRRSQTFDEVIFEIEEQALTNLLDS